MDGTELENLVIRLTGDAQQYMKMLEDAAKKTEEAATKVEAAGSKIEAINHKIESFGEKTEKYLLRVGLAIGAWEAFEKADRAEANLRHLEAAIESNGGAVDETLKSYKEFAKGISEVTSLSKGETVALLAKTEAYGLTGAAAQKAAKDAVALASLPGNEGASPEAFLRVTAAMARGNTEMAMGMARLIPQLRGVKDEVEFTEKYTKLLGLGMKVAQGDVEDATGQLNKMKQTLGGVTKEIGELLAKGINPTIAGLKATLDFLNSMDPALKKVVVGVLAVVAASKLLGVSLINPWTAALVAIGLVVAAIGRAKQAMAEFEAKMKAGAEAGAERTFEEFNKGNRGLTSDERIAKFKEGARLAGERAVQFGGSSPKDPHHQQREQFTMVALELQKKFNQAVEDELKLQKDLAAAKLAAGVAAADELIAKLQMEATTMDMDADAAEVYKLKLIGLNAEKLAEVEETLGVTRELRAEKEARDAAAKAAQDLEDSYAKINESLDDQIAKLTLTEDAYQRLRLAQQGFTQDQVDSIRVKQDQVAQLEEENKAVSDTLDAAREVQATMKQASAAGSVEALSRIADFQASVAAGFGARGTDGSSVLGGVGPRGGSGSDAVARQQSDKSQLLLTQISQNTKKIADKPDLMVLTPGL